MKRKRRKSKSVQKKETITKILISLSIIFIILIYIINNASFIRPLLWIISTILLTAAFRVNKKMHIIRLFIIFFCLFALSLALDGTIAALLKRIPAYSYNITTNNKTRVYNSLGVRVWQCDINKEEYKVDVFYNKGYLCNAEDLSAIDSNSFLNSIVENYDDYHNQYVKIVGKVSKKNGHNYLEMQPYTESENKINGYVEFANNITLRAIFSPPEKELDNYDIYDEITIIGKVKNLDKSSNQYVIYMYETKVVSTISLSGYQINVVKEDTCSDKNKIYSTDTNDIYTYCIKDIIVSYPDSHNELVDSLSSNKILIEDLYSDPNEVLSNEDDNSALYKMDNYNILVCDPEYSKDIIIGPPNLNFKSTKCIENQ